MHPNLKTIVTILIVCLPYSIGMAQANSTSLAGLSKVDSSQPNLSSTIVTSDSCTISSTILKADSTRSQFISAAKKLKIEHQNSLLNIETQQYVLRHKIDSLQSLNLPTDKLTQTLDSLQATQAGITREFDKTLSDIKNKTTKAPSLCWCVSVKGVEWVTNKRTYYQVAAKRVKVWE